MNKQINIDAEQACRDLVVRYAILLDRGEWEAFAALFTESAVLGNAEGVLIGRKAIRAAFSSRSTDLVWRHVITNIIVDVSTDNEAQGTSYLTLYRSRAPGSRALVEGPWLIGEYNDLYRRTVEGWRIEERQFSIAFKSTFWEDKP